MLPSPCFATNCRGAYVLIMGREVFVRYNTALHMLINRNEAGSAGILSTFSITTLTQVLYICGLLS